MTWEAWATIAVVLVTLSLLARNRLPADAALLGAAIVLIALGLFSTRLPSAKDLARAFGNEAVLTAGVLFVVAGGLSETGGMAWLVQRALGRPMSVRAAQTRLMAPVVSISAFLNNTPVVAMFMPVVQDWCKRTGMAPSKLFIPLSYAAILGGICTLIGTSTNLLVQGLLIEAHEEPMGMLTLTPIGLPCALAGLAFLVLFSSRLLPERQTLRVHNEDTRNYTVEMLVETGSAVAGQTIEQAGLRHLSGLYLSGIERDGERLVAVGSQQVLRGEDRLIFVGVVDSVADLQKIRGLRPATNQVFKLSEPRFERCLIEAVVSDTCPGVGRSIREGRFRNRYEAAVIAVHRNGERIEGKIGDIVLRAGDNLLLEAHPAFVEKHRNSRDFFLVSGVPDSQPRRHEKAWVALAILGAMVAFMVFGARLGLGTLTLALIAAALMLVSGCCSLERARREIAWSVLLAIAGALVVGKAFEMSGAAAALSGAMIDLARPLGPVGLLAGVYLLTLILTEFVNHSAAAVLAFPVAHAAAMSEHLRFMPFAVAIAVAASAGFAQPLSYQTHMMVYGPGGYRFSDYLKIGVPLDLLVMGVAVALIPLWFPLAG